MMTLMTKWWRWQNDGKMMAKWWQNDGKMMTKWWENDVNDEKMMAMMTKWWQNVGNDDKMSMVIKVCQN